MVFTQPIEMRMNERVAGLRADVGVKLFGDDLDQLRALAAEVQTALRSIPGSADCVIGGPIADNVLTLLVLPALYSLFGSRDEFRGTGL